MSDAIPLGVILVLLFGLSGSCKPVDQGPVAPAPKESGLTQDTPGEGAGADPMEGWDVIYEFTGEVAHVGTGSDRTAPYIQLDFDPHFVVVVTELGVIRGAPPEDKGTVALGVHSLVRLFGSMSAEDIVGRRYVFRVRQSQHGRTLWLDPPRFLGPLKEQ